MKKTYPATTPLLAEPQQRFVITHPFHPWRGREVERVDLRRYKGDDLLYFYDDGGFLVSVRREWTNLAETDPFKELALNKECFRTDDLIRLADLVEGLSSSQSHRGEGQP